MAGVAEEAGMFLADRLAGAERFRHFGSEGPLYEVIGPTVGERVRVRVVESGEEFDYRVSELLSDPLA
jgi:hypothetical protein